MASVMWRQLPKCDTLFPFRVFCLWHSTPILARLPFIANFLQWYLSTIVSMETIISRQIIAKIVCFRLWSTECKRCGITGTKFWLMQIFGWIFLSSSNTFIEVISCCWVLYCKARWALYSLHYLFTHPMETQLHTVGGQNLNGKCAMFPSISSWSDFGGISHGDRSNPPHQCNYPHTK